MGDAGLGAMIEKIDTGMARFLDLLKQAPGPMLQIAGIAAGIANSLAQAAVPLGILAYLFPGAARAAVQGIGALPGTLGFMGAGGTFGGLGPLAVGRLGLAEAETAGSALWEGIKKRLAAETKAEPPPAVSGGYLGGLSDAAKNLMASGTPKFTVESNIKIDHPTSLDIRVIAPDGRVAGQGQIPMTVAPRGEHQDAPGAWQKDY